MRQLFMRRIDEPLPLDRPQSDQDEQVVSRATLSGSGELGSAAPALPLDADSPDVPEGRVAIPPTPPNCGASAPPPSSSDLASCSEEPPPARQDAPQVATLKATRLRLAAELEDVRAQVACLRAAVASAKTLIRERGVEAAIAGPEDEHAKRAVVEARSLLAAAAESLAQEEANAEALRVAFDRVSVQTEAAVAAQQNDEHRLVREVVSNPHAVASAKARLIEALDWLWLDARLRTGSVGSAQALLGSALGLSIHAETMWRRSHDLFSRVLSEARSGKAVVS